MDSFKQQENAYLLLEDPLKYPGLPERKMVSNRVRLWVYPSFEPFISWTVFQSKNEYFARRVVWDQRKIVLTAEPQTYGTEVKINKSVVYELRESLEKLELNPFIPVNTVGIDGTTQGVEFGNYMLSAKLSWWGAADQNWISLEKWLQKYSSLVNGLFPGKSF